VTGWAARFATVVAVGRDQSIFTRVPAALLGTLVALALPLPAASAATAAPADSLVDSIGVNFHE